MATSMPPAHVGGKGVLVDPYTQIALLDAVDNQRAIEEQAMRTPQGRAAWERYYAHLAVFAAYGAALASQGRARPPPAVAQPPRCQPQQPVAVQMTQMNQPNNTQPVVMIVGAAEQPVEIGAVDKTTKPVFSM